MLPPGSRSRPSDLRPSLRTIADAAGVSAMTVSRVLRNHPKVSPTLRARVQKIALQLGYQPDPTVAKLMHHLRVRRKPAFQNSICALTTNPQHLHSTYTSEVRRGVEQQVRERGYGFTFMEIDASPDARPRIQRILRSRGVEGVLLLPMKVPTTLDGLLDWEEFSVVSTTSSVESPELHRVTPHHYYNTQLLCQHLGRLGYRRIGLILHVLDLKRVHHIYPAAVTWNKLITDGTVVPPLIHDGDEPAGLTQWFKKERPDAIVCHMEKHCRAYAARLRLAIPGQIGFVTANCATGSDIGGIDQRPTEIGRAAADLLVSMIQRGEKGIPEVPTSLLIPGRWVEHAACPPHRPRKAAAARPYRSKLVYLDGVTAGFGPT